LERSAFTGTLPPNHFWQAARRIVSGLAGHDSAVKGVVPLPHAGTAPLEKLAP
jgi:hypothetical protein